MVWLKRSSSLAFLLFVSLQPPLSAQGSDQLFGSPGPFQFRSLGPALVSGRISDVAVDPRNRSVWYVGVSAGNVWKTENRGTTWTPIFDKYGSYSIGAVTLDPENPDVVWVGTGENASQRSAGFGDGIYKSVNGGISFQHMGLHESEHIGDILVDPRNSDVVYAASQGPLWSSGGDRGLFKTTDGGESWDLVLEVSENTGIADIVFDVYDPGYHLCRLLPTAPACGHPGGRGSGGEDLQVHRCRCHLVRDHDRDSPGRPGADRPGGLSL